MAKRPVKTKIEFKRARRANTEILDRMVYASRCGRFKIEKLTCLLDGRTVPQGARRRAHHNAEVQETKTEEEKMKKKTPWDQDMPSEQEIEILQFSTDNHGDYRIEAPDPGTWEPQKVGKEWRVTIDGQYIYYKRKKDAQAALDNPRP